MNDLIKKAEVAYGWFLKAVNGLQSPFLLLIRVYWGWLFLQSGIGKFGHIDKVVSFFTDLGIPAPTLNAYFNASLETIGGILLILGLASRLIAVPLLLVDFRNTRAPKRRLQAPPLRRHLPRATYMVR